MKKILLSIATLGVVGALAIGATTAIFSDDEVSTGNTFTAGAIDLKIDNESYYNGVLNEGTTWLQLADLDDGQGPGPDGSYLFFDFRDLKPGDHGEDTISLHVGENDSWLCVDVTLTSDDDNGLTEPEEVDGDQTGGVGEGELADQVDFIWWADDGDNVYEKDEELLPAGPLGVLNVGDTATVALADSQNNIWGDEGPLPGDETRYIGKAWCFGILTPAPVQPGENDPAVDPGFDCDGAPINNITQTDSMTADIVFHAEQSRHNEEFECAPLPVEVGTLQIVKEVDGQADPDSFTFDVNNGGLVLDDVTQGSYPGLTPGTYTVTENPFEGYASNFSSCGTDGQVEIVAGETTICTVTNTEETATLTVDKVIQFSDVQVDVDVNDFDLFIDDGNGPVQVTDEVANTGLAIGNYTVSETYTGILNIIIDAQYSDACTDDGDTGSVTLAADDNVTCVITNRITPIPVI